MVASKHRAFRRKLKTRLDETEIEFLRTGQDPPRDTPGYSLMVSEYFDDSKDRVREVWQEHRDELKRLWRSQGHHGPSWAEIQFDMKGGKDGSTK